MYIGHSHVSVYLCVVCLSLAAFSHYCTDPDVTEGMVGGALQLWTIGQIWNPSTGFIAMTT